MVYCRAGRAVCAEAAAAHSRIAAAQEWRRPFIDVPLVLHILALLRRRHVGIFAVSGHSGMVNEAVPEPLDPPAPASAPPPAAAPPETPSRPRRKTPLWAKWSDDKLLDLRMSELDLSIEGSVAAEAHRRSRGGAGRAGHGLSPAFLAVGRVVHARRRARHRHPVLSRAPAAGAARARADARSRGGHAVVVHAHPAPRARPRHRQRLHAPPPPAPPGAVRVLVDRLPRVLHAEAVQPQLRPAHRQLVCAEPSRRGLRRDLRRLAESAIRLAPPLS